MRRSPGWRSFLTIALLMSTMTMTAVAVQAQTSQPQTRPHSKRVEVDPSKVRVGDGDTVTIEWGDGEFESVRILGIDTPETRNPEHNLPYSQSFGLQATAFARGAFALADKIEILRTPATDRYGRTLGYLFLNGKNYSVLVVAAGLAEESVSRYGDNGFPEQAQAVIEAARAAGPTPFESPGNFRRRMRELSEWMKEKGTYPEN